MYTLNLIDLYIVSGGNPILTAVAIGASTYVGAATLVNATQTLNDFGRTIGERVYNNTHPNPLGKMVYTAQAFN